MPNFAALWLAHPSLAAPPDNAPCRKKDGSSAFENQCAIRLGVALAGGGVSLRSFRGARCWFGHSHVLRALELARWIETAAVGVIGCKKKVVYRKVTDSDFRGRTGIVLFENFWGAGNQGDHIDLWNGSVVAHGSTDYFSRSERVSFWEIA